VPVNRLGVVLEEEKSAKLARILSGLQPKAQQPKAAESKAAEPQAQPRETSGVKNDPNAVHVVANTVCLARGGKFLILRRKEDELVYPGKWEFPGGNLYNGELMSDSLRREVKDQTGLEIDGAPMFAGDFEYMRGDGFHVFGLKFIGRAKGGQIKLSPAHTQYAWITPEETVNYDLVKGLDDEIAEAARVFPK
jgi:ADP-ribose pyrophosphatase YjhB (NUDIX family)